MARIKPFKAVRPPRDKANLVASRPFYTYEKSILSAKLQSNKYTFLHVINPDIGGSNKTLPNSQERFLKVREKFDDFITKGYFIKDTEDTFYIYRQQSDIGDFVGIVAGASVKEYLQGSIKIHENTLAHREETFKEYLNICNFNAEPVLLTYPDNKDIEAFINTYLGQRSEYEFTTTDNKKHDLWLVNESKQKRDLVNLFEKINSVYIADGHHRSASSVKHAQSKGLELEGNHNFFLAFFIPESQLKILDYNRMAMDLNGLSSSQFLEQVSKKFVMNATSILKKPDALHQFTMLLDDKIYTLSPKPGTVQENDPVRALDVKILSDFILQPILGISNAKNDLRLRYIDGTIAIEEIRSIMKKKGAKVVFALFPVSIDQLKKVADAKQIMPPKSTWIEPKLRSGLTIYEY